MDGHGRDLTKKASQEHDAHTIMDGRQTSVAMLLAKKRTVISEVDVFQVADGAKAQPQFGGLTIADGHHGAGGVEAEFAKLGTELTGL